MSEDLHSNPPFEILLKELGPENNSDVKTYKTGGEVLVLCVCLKCHWSVFLVWNLTKNVIMIWSFQSYHPAWLPTTNPWPVCFCNTLCSWVRHLTWTCSVSFYAGGYSTIEKSVTIPLLPTSFFTRKKSAFQKVSFLMRTCDTHASYPWGLAMYHYLHAEIHGSLSGPMRRLEPLTWQSLTACVLAGVCGLLNFLRCFPFLNVIVIDEEVRKLW